MLVFELPVDNGLTDIERKIWYQISSNINSVYRTLGFNLLLLNTIKLFGKQKRCVLYINSFYDLNKYKFTLTTLYLWLYIVYLLFNFSKKECIT